MQHWDIEPEKYLATCYDEKSLDGWFLTRSHEVLEKRVPRLNHFSRVLEVGSGPGNHAGFVKHGYDSYTSVDISVTNLAYARSKSHEIRGSKSHFFLASDARLLPFSDAVFDRTIACHVLEHLRDPEAAILECKRVTRPGGVLSILLPCDPGLSWRIGRHLFVRSKYKNMKPSYDYWMAKEHINSIFNLASIIDHNFPNSNPKYYPIGTSSADLNLFYLNHVQL